MAKILSLAAIPFIAMWKNDPRSLRGIKNSDARRIIVRAPAKLNVPARNSDAATIIPAAAPP